MKRLVIPAVILLCSSFSAFAKETDSLPVITVTGAAELQIAPNEAVFTLVVKKANKELPIAKRLNDESIAKILELTRRFSVLPQHVQTGQISVDTKYETVRDTKSRTFITDEGDYEKRIFSGYEVSKTVTVRLTDLSRFEDFFTEVLKTGLSNVKNVTFETSRLREHKDKAREMAMKAAKEKATAMAATLGQSIGKAVNITEGSFSSYSYMGNSANSNVTGTSGNFGNSQVTFAPGAITVNAQVTVSFRLN